MSKAPILNSDLDWGQLARRPTSADVLVTHSKHTMAHGSSFRGYCYGHIPFVSTEWPHVPCMYAAGHPESHYWRSGPGAGGPFTTDPAAQSSLTQVTRNCNCYCCFSFSTLFYGEKKSLMHCFHFYSFSSFFEKFVSWSRKASK